MKSNFVFSLMRTSSRLLACKRKTTTVSLIESYTYLLSRRVYGGAYFVICRKPIRGAAHRLTRNCSSELADPVSLKSDWRGLAGSSVDRAGLRPASDGIVEPEL
jgi:hypothetical protein